MKAKLYGRGRTFLNTPASYCMGAVEWHVTTRPHYNQKKYPGRMELDAELNINRDAMHQYVCLKKDMAPIYKMREVLNKFITLAEEGLDDVHGT